MAGTKNLCLTLRLLAAALCCLLLGSCNIFDPTKDELMRPPRLTEEQRAIEDALLRSVISSDVRFKYPKTGAYRSAFIFYDIDGDSVEEALVFYCVGNGEYARLSVLDQDESGQWAALCELPGYDRDVEFISFEHITSPESVDIVIGWSGNIREQNHLGVYTMRDGTLQSRLDDEYTYSTYLIDDLDGNGMRDIFLLSGDMGTQRDIVRTISMLSYDGYDISLAGINELSTSVVSYAGVCAGQLYPDKAQRAIFVDETLLANMLVTEVFTVVDGELEAVIWSDMAELASAGGNDAPAPDAASGDEYENPLVAAYANTLYGKTMRADRSAVCGDFDSDGVIEIPSSQLLPGHTELERDQRIYLTEYNHMLGERLVRAFAAVVNRNAGYMLRFPENWIGRVTVSSQPEINEWHFIVYDDKLDDPLENLSGELARIRVVSQKDYQDKFIENYSVLATRGAFTYYGYVQPEAPAPYAVGVDTIAQTLFSLI